MLLFLNRVISVICCRPSGLSASQLEPVTTIVYDLSQVLRTCDENEQKDSVHIPTLHIGRLYTFILPLSV